jgi:hypothetical protein
MATYQCTGRSTYCGADDGTNGSVARFVTNNAPNGTTRSGTDSATFGCVCGIAAGQDLAYDDDGDKNNS